MSRLQADGLLLIAAIIWGLAFIAQKTGMDELGPFGFIGARFFLSSLVVLPLAFRESRRRPSLLRRDMPLAATVAVVFLLVVSFQQVGLMTTTVTNAGFLTGLYVVMTPAAAWLLFRRRSRAVIIPAGFMAVAGTWFLGGAAFSSFGSGDWYILSCALFSAVHIVLLGYAVQKTARPMTFVVVQYIVCAVAGLLAALIVEDAALFPAVKNNLFPLFFAGVISGGVAFTLQAVAQQHTPPSDAAVIMAGESVFAALGGMVLLGERLDGMGWLGCVLILGAILLVEVAPLLFIGKKRSEQGL